MADKEGPAGAFFKGVLTTLLATPLQRSIADSRCRVGAGSAGMADIFRVRRPRAGDGLTLHFDRRGTTTG